MSTSLAGGCLCAALRYEVRGEPITVALCHCSMCRRSAGAPLVAWAMFARDALVFVEGKPAIYRSSPGVERGFCGTCGTQLIFRAEFLPDLVDLTVASLDEPQALAPRMHIWDKSRLPWIAVSDALPRHPELPPRPAPGG